MLSGLKHSASCMTPWAAQVMLNTYVRRCVFIYRMSMLYRTCIRNLNRSVNYASRSIATLSSFFALFFETVYVFYIDFREHSFVLFLVVFVTCVLRTLRRWVQTWSLLICLKCWTVRRQVKPVALSRELATVGWILGWRAMRRISLRILLTLTP